MGITLRNESRLIPFDRTIRITFDLKNPQVLKRFTPSWKVHQVLDFVCSPRLYPSLITPFPLQHQDSFTGHRLHIIKVRSCRHGHIPSNPTDSKENLSMLASTRILGFSHWRIASVRRWLVII